MIFWTKIRKQQYFQSETKNEHKRWILPIRIHLNIKFHIKLTILIFWTWFAQKAYFPSKTEKWTTSLNSAWISLGNKFQLRLTIVFGPNLPKNPIPVLNRKREHYDWILHIRFSLDTNFQLKLGILNFWTKFAQKGYFRLKIEKLHFFVCSWSLLIILNFSAREPTDTTTF